MYLRGGYGVASVLYPLGFTLRVGLDPPGLRAGRPVEAADGAFVKVPMPRGWWVSPSRARHVSALVLVITSRPTALVKFLIDAAAALARLEVPTTLTV